MKKWIVVDFYMKSGSVITLRFTEFEINRFDGSKARDMIWKGNEFAFTIDMDEIEAVVMK